MYQIIAPTLFQNKICRLPGIGTLVIVAHSAETDFTHSLIKSPTETIEFIAESNDDKVFNEFSAMSELLQKSLEENGSFYLKGIGTFTKDNSLKIRFEPIAVETIFTPPIPIERVARQAEPHAILVGDQQTTNVEMSEYFVEKPPLKSRWRVWAIILASVGTVALCYYFYHYGFKAFGNVGYFK